MAEGAYSANTLQAHKADGAIFQAFSSSSPIIKYRPLSALSQGPANSSFVDGQLSLRERVPNLFEQYLLTRRRHINCGSGWLLKFVDPFDCNENHNSDYEEVE